MTVCPRCGGELERIHAAENIIRHECADVGCRPPTFKDDLRAWLAGFWWWS